MTRDEVLEWLESDIEAAKFRMELVDISLLRAAAEIIRESGWRPIAEAPDDDDVLGGKYANGRWVELCLCKRVLLDLGYTHYLPKPAPPAREAGE